ncbi:FAD-dependent oxidoreductase [Deinococcus sp. MIMF12]|uniref:FAD-dependent oxidoreductase n=1 Tax=Deinococcus rhizophilus TaxID=3049544 RepID=A0ABT7JL69_9DEIO|nr:FAD-dependent oxidoreductase [Deinococcus rhizophilus]MDL2345362.1 FAD-dependent oxidoreductase [Deinococcus rhizophilus]
MNHVPLNIVIVGGVAGGMSAATRLRRLDEHARITVLERGEHVSFANCGLPYHLSDAIPDRERLLLHTPESLAARFRLDVRTRHEVTAIDREARRVTVTDQRSGQVHVLPYDKLILSPGAAPILPPLPGVPLAFPLRTLPDLDRLKAAAKTRGPNAVVIGAGFIGLEVAENLREAGKAVTLVEAAPQVLPPLDPELAVLVQRELERHGVTVISGVGFSAITEQSVTLADGRVLPADLVALAVGVRPEDTLARQAGLDVAGRGGILVNGQLQTSDPDIYAVGDAALVRDALGNVAFVPLAWGANRQGRLVADHIAGRDVSFGGHPATAIAKVFGLTAASTGLNERQVRALGLTPAVVHTHPGSHAGYYPGAEPIHLKLVFDARTGRIYGAQAVGGQGTDKRIDVLATALHAGLSAEDLADLPLAYAPPYSSAKDPVNMLGYVAQNVMDGLTRTRQWHEVAGTHRLVVDVREPAEYARGSIPGAVNVPLNDLRSRLDELREQPVLVYCQVGQRGHAAARLLTELGVDAVNLDGGFLTWQAGRAVPTRLPVPG